MAGDPKFKTFEAAYPHVVRKLLTDNSLDMRRILHSVFVASEHNRMLSYICSTNNDSTKNLEIDLTLFPVES